ncbi:hypothetical protein [Streptomyces xiamenensis]|uniref:hypothetical protein n=1 Tax=Streptomyces xiamenensis TaxID=408015 RepID=UPI0035E0DEAA
MNANEKNEAVSAMRKLWNFRSKEVKLQSFGVCAIPPFRGILTEGEYGPIFRAAEAKHDAYMQEGTDGAADNLAYCLYVRNSVVAYILHDGAVRVIERDFGDSLMNEYRDLARRHLGTSEEAQQMLADDRGDVDLMSLEGFQLHIDKCLRRAEPGSRYNEYPEGMTVREYDNANRKWSESEQRWIWPRNPTVEYSETRRRYWAGMAAWYLNEFKKRHPLEYLSWFELMRRTANNVYPTPILRKGDRVILTTAYVQGGNFVPAIVTEATADGPSYFATLHGEERIWNVRPYSLIEEKNLLGETREYFAHIWEKIKSDNE